MMARAVAAAAGSRSIAGLLIGPLASKEWSLPYAPGGIAVDDAEVVVSLPSGGDLWRLRTTTRPAAASVAHDGREFLGALHRPRGLSFGESGDLYIADEAAHGIRRVSSAGVDSVAGGASGSADGRGSSARLFQPADVAVGPDGKVYVADAGNNLIRAIDADGVLSTVAGSIYDYGDGAGPAARFRWPSGIAVGSDGIVYVSDTGNNAIRVIAAGGVVRTLAGSPPGGSDDGNGVRAGFRWPMGLTVSSDGGLYVSDFGNSAVRCIAPDGRTTTVDRTLGWHPVDVGAIGSSMLLVAEEASASLSLRGRVRVVEI